VGAEREELTSGAVLARYVGAFADELAACGVENVCLCPGSRSTPLALVLMRHPSIRVWTHLDERSCAFFALGMAKASGKPVAVLCSSGTAAVNFAPAVVEAHHAHVPLIVLTADRPQELRGVGATQTIDQTRLYGPNVKLFVELLLPEASPEALRYVRQTASRAVATALEDAAGPVHLNFPFREPLVPDVREALATTPLVSVMQPRLEPRTDDVLALSERLRTARRGLIVCGPQDDPELATAATQLSEKLGFPLVADVLSQTRNGAPASATVIGAYDSFLRDAGTVEALAPDLVLRFGATVVSKPLQQYLLHHRDAYQVLVAPDLTWSDPDLTADAVVYAGATAACEALSASLANVGTDGDEAWLGAWREAERLTLATLNALLTNESRVSEPGAFFALAEALPEDATVFAGNSMPVRDLDTFFPASAKRVRFLANRGASGIDGVVSAALGAGAVSAGRLVLMIGDLSFYHDMNGLVAARRFGLDATIVLLNNDGGGIFSFLPQADDPEHFEELFGTPHGLDFRPAAALYGLDYCVAETPAEYRAALAHSFATPGVGVIEVKTDRRENLALHRRLWREVALALHDRSAK
jgi:2-succinyl-5-enolpyruvyl-6-hydroxy-3-cyclohexene-1-carboxylate synthase